MAQIHSVVGFKQFLSLRINAANENPNSFYLFLGVSEKASYHRTFRERFSRLPEKNQLGMDKTATPFRRTTTAFLAVHTRLNVTAFFVSWILGAAAWVVAQNVPGNPKTTGVARG